MEKTIQNAYLTGMKRNEAKLYELTGLGQTLRDTAKFNYKTSDFHKQQFLQTFVNTPSSFIPL